MYKWFDHLKSKGNKINGLVIMPNHVHALISFIATGQSINTIIGNGKRPLSWMCPHHTIAMSGEDTGQGKGLYVGNISKGIYFIKFKNNDNTQTQKLIKQ